MRKIKPFIIFGGLSASLLIFRVIQLFLINESGIVDPWWMILPVYLILLTATAFVFLLIKGDKSKETVSDFSVNFICETAVLIFSLLLFCEGVSSLIHHIAWDAVTVAAISAIISFIFFAVSFTLRRFKLTKPATVFYFLGFIEIIVYLVAVCIEIFVANGTSLSLNLNLLSLISFISQLFLFKALAKEFIGIGTKTCEASLIRSSLLLFVILPAEIIGQILTRTGLLSDFPVPPFRSSFLEILISCCLLVLTVCVLMATKATAEKPLEDNSSEE